MTQAEITALNDLVRRTFGQGSGPAIVPNFALSRLIEERNRLLNDLRVARQHVEHKEVRARLDADIAAAEAP